MVKLFKPGIYHTTPGTANERGTGLGLVICQEMIARHGGQFTIESEPRAGATIKFTMPQAR